MFSFEIFIIDTDIDADYGIHLADDKAEGLKWIINEMYDAGIYPVNLVPALGRNAGKIMHNGEIVAVYLISKHD